MAPSSLAMQYIWCTYIPALVTALGTCVGSQTLNYYIDTIAKQLIPTILYGNLYGLVL